MTPFSIPKVIFKTPPYFHFVHEMNFYFDVIVAVNLSIMLNVFVSKRKEISCRILLFGKVKRKHICCNLSIYFVFCSLLCLNQYLLLNRSYFLYPFLYKKWFFPERLRQVQLFFPIVSVSSKRNYSLYIFHKMFASFFFFFFSSFSF